MSPTNTSPSEPFQLDFIRWAKEIANLSLRYSNLKSYQVEDFQENVNLGYFKQIYIDSVETTGIFINPKVQFMNAGKLHIIYYVDKDAVGNKNGSSWINAATSVSSLNWNKINAGDTVYISGGSDSTIYPKDILSNIVFSSPVIITKGKDTGHNGKVIFEQSGVPTGNKCSFGLVGCENIKLNNLTFKTAVEDQYYGEYLLRLQNGQKNIVDNCHIISNGNGFGLTLSKETEDIITNNLIETLTNTLQNYGEDPIWVGNGGGGHIIKGNTLIQRGIFSTGAHSDIIQMYQEGSPKNYQMTIANNMMIFDNDESTSGQGFYANDMYTNRLLFYNNIIVLNTHVNAGFTYIGIADSCRLSARIFNNTILISVGTCITSRGIDTLFVKNNILLSNDNTSHFIYMLGQSSIDEITYKDIDYNQYYRLGGIENKMIIPHSGSSISWTAWKEIGYDAHSYFGSVNFAHIWGSSILDYETLSGRNLGVDLTDYFTVDILGASRPLGKSWDMGAIEK